MLCAVTVAEPPEGGVGGAVYIPADETVPTVELPPWTPFTSQLTDVFVVPETVAENCLDWLVCRLVEVGDTETDTGVGAAVIVTPALALFVVS
jgi:hypothetical protein